MSRMEDRGFAALGAAGREDVASTGASLGDVPFGVGTGVCGVVGVIPLSLFAYLLYKANSEPDDVRPEDGERALEALASGDEAGAVIETLAVAKNRKTMKTPLGFRVPNLARFMLPEAEQTRAMGSMLSSKGVGR